MAGLVPAIHVFAAQRKRNVDARQKAGHDEPTLSDAEFGKHFPIVFSKHRPLLRLRPA
jgi:hypothetical protein